MRRSSLLLPLVVATAILTYGLWRSASTREHVAPAPTREDIKEKAEAPLLEVPTLTTGLVSAGSGGGQIRGLVRDEAEAPVVGVPVAILERIRIPYLSSPGPWLVENAARPDVVVARLVTDAQGRFVCTGLQLGRYYDVRAEPRPPQTGSFTTALLRADHETDLLLRMRAGSALTGRVVDHDGRGVRALVSATWKRRQFNRIVESWRVLDHTTGVDGHFELAAVPMGQLRLSVRVPGRVVVSDLRVGTPHDGSLTVRLGSRDAARIQGRVTDSAGAPIPGARVHLAERRTGAPDRLSAQHVVVADASGAYAMALPAPMLLTHLKITADGYVDRELESLNRPYEQGTVDTIDFVLLRGARVRGRVRTEDGRPISGVRVRLGKNRRAQRGDPVWITDDEGAFEVGGLSPAVYSVQTELEGYVQKPPASAITSGGGVPYWARLVASFEVVEEGAAATTDITMLAGVPIVGRVVDGDQKPVQGARVWIGRRANVAFYRGGARALYGGEGETHTDADGRFRFVRVVDGRDYFLVATTDKDLSDEVRVRPSQEGKPPETVLLLRRASTLAGVAQHADGSPFPFAKYRLKGPVRRSGAADRDGRFRINLLPGGRYVIDMHGPFASEAETRVLAGGDVVEDVVIKAPQFHAISGVLVGVDGKPLGDMRVTLVGEKRLGLGTSMARATTDADGRFRAEGLLLGPYRARIEGLELEHTVEAGATAARFVHVPLPRTEVRGTVLDPAGMPVASGTVSVSCRSLRDRGTTGRSAPILGGTFRVSIQTRGDTVELRVRDPRDVRGIPIDVAPQRWEDLAIADAPFELRLVGGEIVEGIVVDRDGKGVGGVRMKAQHAESLGRRARREEGGTSTTDVEGRFRFERLRPGAVVLTLQPPPEYLPVPERTIEAGATDVHFKLRRGGFVEGRVLEEDGRPASNIPVQAVPRNHPLGPWGHGMTAADGTFRLVGLDPSIEYRVRTDFDGRRGGRNDLVRMGSDWVRAGTTGIEIRLIKGVFISGRVLAPDGNPASSGGSVVASPKDSVMQVEGGSIARLESEDGTFSLGPVLPGSYEVTAQTRDPMFGPSEPVLVEAPAANVELRYPSRLTRAGVVHGDDVEHFRVTWWAQTVDGSLVMGRGVAASDGRFTIGQMGDMAGTAFVYSRNDGRCAWIENVRPSAQPLEVRLVEGLTITGRVELSSPPLKKRNDWSMVMARLKGGEPFNLRSTLDAAGNFEIRGVPRGTFVVRYSSTPQFGPAVEVEAGATGVVLRDK